MLKFRIKTVLLLLIIVILILSGCKAGPEPINYGHDECEFCRMQITDNRYGSEIVTDKGKVFKFDEIGCMIEYALVKNFIGDANQKFLVTDFAKPETFIDATNAFFIQNENFRSPMGSNVMGFSSEISRQKFIAESGGSLLNWVDVIELVKKRSM
ncbi:MAG: nitrous oxide reductase accessory protein NosL [Ignavibacteriaceae bacterium]|nr:nitrous oxide reductase accessory protein NosL [Ignavibacteriaceae bacterium]MCU0406165.1 nitrous oxide reductase accessory protein NosL [Ignavibacteriaceae bacterium]